jgi:PTS system N-acetylglucosamine-specific IIB component
VKERFQPVLSGYDQFSVIHPTVGVKEGKSPPGQAAGGKRSHHWSYRSRRLRCSKMCSERAPSERAAMSKAEKIIEGLGGAGNIVEVEACITRLRTEVKDSSLVNEATLKAAGAHGVLAAGTAVQVIVGPEADTLAEDIEDLL